MVAKVVEELLPIRLLHFDMLYPRLPLISELHLASPHIRDSDCETCFLLEAHPGSLLHTSTEKATLLQHTFTDHMD